MVTLYVIQTWEVAIAKVAFAMLLHSAMEVEKEELGMGVGNPFSWICASPRRIFSLVDVNIKPFYSLSSFFLAIPSVPPPLSPRVIKKPFWCGTEGGGNPLLWIPDRRGAAVLS